MKKISLHLITIGMLTACAPQKNHPLEELASQTAQDIACKDQNLEAKLWDGLKSYLIAQNEVPRSNVLKLHFHQKVEELRKNNSQLTLEDVEKITKNLDDIIDTILKDAPMGERAQTPQQVLLLLSAIDVGDRSTEFRSKVQDEVRSEFTRLATTIRSYSLACTPSSPSTQTSEQNQETENVASSYEMHKQEAISTGIPLAAFGARWAFATAYQSCQSLQLPPMTSQTPDLEGIKVIGKHPDGVGLQRVIASLSLVQKSHYYIRDMSDYGEGCFNVRQNPLIYDYGGKPYATTAASSPIDFFKNSGNGTDVLGVDCSGYVFSAMAAAGLKLKVGRPLKASDSWAWGSSSYVEPQKNGLTCLNKITVSSNSSIQPGDIVAVDGHMLMIEKIGSDPFGIKAMRSESDCRKINSNLFDFIIIQSSNSKNGVGINRYEAREYLPTSEKMKVGLEKYAYYACMAKITGKSSIPSLGSLSIVRHKGTSDCIAPRISLVKESCIQSCPQL